MNVLLKPPQHWIPVSLSGVRRKRGNYGGKNNDSVPEIPPDSVVLFFV